MKMTKKQIVFILLLVLISASCRKHDDPPVVYEEENPLPGFLSTSGFNQKQDETAFMLADKEYGFSFRPTVNGKLISVLVNTPETGSNFQIRIYDNATTSLIKTEAITITTAYSETTKVLATALVLEKNKDYSITLTSPKAIFRYRSDWGAITFPVTSGNILVTAVVSKPTLSSPFPSTKVFAGYLGDITFKFQRTE